MVNIFEHFVSIWYVETNILVGNSGIASPLLNKNGNTFLKNQPSL